MTIGSSVGVERLAGLLDDTLVREQLVTISWDGRPGAKLADRWEPLTDGFGVRLFLRPNVTFHNGEPFTPEIAAEQIAASLKSPATRSVSASSVIDVKAEKNAVVIRTSRREAFLLADLADITISAPRQPTAGTGPFQLAKRTPSEVQLKPFDGYHRGRPTLEQVTFRAYPSQRSAWSALMRGEIDGVHEVSQDAVDFIEEQSSVRTYPFLRPYYVALIFNVRHPAFRNPEVRRALNLAVDREAIVRQAMRSRGEPAHGPVWPRHWAYTTAAPAFTYNPEAARLRLDAAGFPARESEDGMKRRLSFKCVLWADDTKLERHAMILQKQLYDIGVDMQIVPISGEQMIAAAASGNFDAILAEQTSGRNPAWVYQFYHSPEPGRAGLLNTGYKSADIALDNLRAAQSDDDTRSAIADLQRVLHDDPPAVFIAWNYASRALRTTFTVPPDPPDIIGSIWQWRRTAAVQAQRD